ncbi:MAG: recombinase family protein [bacterium]|nr:recombinase family protein [bacterium]
MNSRITSTHLERRAVIYVRQSSLAQVHNNQESTARQYELAKRAELLGWPASRIEIIDEDLGRSGASTEGRSGFVRLAQAVAGGGVGAVFALEVSRLARCSQDWQRLLRLCAVAQTLVVDETSAYDPGTGDDKLLLDLKGTMSEAELRWLALRMQGARLQKARRGALRLTPATGYVWAGDRFELDPDDSIRRAIEVVLERFATEPTAGAVVRWAHRTGFQIPTRRGDTVRWGALGTTRLLNLLHNPAYTGAYVFGQQRKEAVLIGGEIRHRRRRLPPQEWSVLLHDAHPAYISWETWQANQRKLRDNAQWSPTAARGAPRNGAAMLPGIVLCGRCGRRMRPAYSQFGWSYVCHGDLCRGGSRCWSIAGAHIDTAVESLFLQAMLPEELDLSLAVAARAKERSEALEAQWRARLERAEYETRRAESRFKAVDPDNRAVARTLEREWEERLRELEDVRDGQERARHQSTAVLSSDDEARVRALASNLRAVWQAPTTAPSDRKAMMRLAIEAVCLHPIDLPKRNVRIVVAWRSGANSEVVMARPKRCGHRFTSPHAMHRLCTLVAEGVHDAQIAEVLNAEGVRSGSGNPWTPSAVGQIRRNRGLSRVAPDRTRRAPLPDRHPDGAWTVPGLVRHARVSKNIVRRWIKQGLVSAERVPHVRFGQVWRVEVTDAQLETLKARVPRRGQNPRVPEVGPDGWLSLTEAARRTGRARATISNWVRKGWVACRRSSWGPYPTVCWVPPNIESIAAQRRNPDPPEEQPRQRTPCGDP